MRPVDQEGVMGVHSTYLEICVKNLYILNAVRCPYATYIRSSVMLGVASSVANEVIMKMTSKS